MGVSTCCDWLYRERDEHIADMKTRHQQQVQRAEQALDTFKHESDKKTERLYEDTRAQVDRRVCDRKCHCCVG